MRKEVMDVVADAISLIPEERKCECGAAVERGRL